MSYIIHNTNLYLNVVIFWYCLDSDTRFLLSNKLSNGRTTKDARELFQKAKNTAKTPAKKIITDGAFAYGKAVKKEFWSYDNRNPHERYVTLRQKTGNNNRIERYHNSFRARDKTMRGFKSMEGTEKFSENYRTFYNFIREHQGLGTTPSDKAGLQKEQWKELLVKAMS